MIYEMITGRAPFEGDTSTDVIVSILEKEPAPLSRYEPDAPSELHRIVSKALSKDRDQRYQTIKDLLIDLRMLGDEMAFEVKLERRLSPGASGGQKAVVTATQPPGQSREQAVQTTSNAVYLVSAIARHKLTAAVALASLILAIGAILSVVYFSRADKPEPIDSLAVLPLVSSGGDPDTEYLSNGITESIIYNLSQLPELKVLPLSSVTSYQAHSAQAGSLNPQVVGTDLKVRAVVIVKVVARGEGLSVSVELVDVGDNRVLWGQQYNRKLTDILAVQEVISREVSDKLRLRLSGEEQQRLARRYTDNPEAYRLYLLGRYFQNKRRNQAIRTGIEYFEQAIRVDPRYTLAYSGLADSYQNLSGVDSSQPPLNYYQKAKEAALKAVELDDALAEAHTSLAAVKEWFEWDWEAAEREYKRALELNPNYATAHHRYSVYLTFMRRFDEAVAEMKQAQQLEPSSLIINTDLGFVYQLMSDYDRAIEQLKKAIEIDPIFTRAHTELASCYFQKGMYDEALAELQKLAEIQKGLGVSRSAAGNAQLGIIYAKQGRRAEALKLLREMEEMSKQRYIQPMPMARLNALLGYKDQAFAWVKKAYEDRSVGLRRMNVAPGGEDLRSDPRVVDLLRRAGLPQ